MRVIGLNGSLRARLVLQLLAVAAVLAVALYFTVRSTADRAAEATQDAILGAATTSIAEQLRATEDGIEVDLAYATFSMLGAVAQDRLFYRIDIGGETVTGYEDLPMPETPPAALAASFYNQPYLDTDLRIAAVARSMVVGSRPVPVLVLVGQTRQGQAAIADSLANRAALIGVGFFVLAVPLSLLSAGSVFNPINRLAEAVGRRGPRDLRPVRHPTPRELAPLVGALNGFVARLRGALSQTETFIAEAAHHIRTPLSTVRTEAEIALRQSDDEATRVRLRSMIRGVETSARSASQLLDHAMVLYRSDQLERVEVDLSVVLRNVARAFEPTAELKELSLRVIGDAAPMRTKGDPLLIEAALRNLVDNAIKYSPAETEVQMVLSAADGMLHVQVRDEGRGLSGATMAELSRRFTRGGNVGDVVGSGLGLTIVAEVAGALGGRFTLEQRETGGTCASFSLPQL
ncbi:sensor histidine kinase [Pseudorhodobacter sp. E13]|uniref:sensor histidine kinase n=1 Tax=Pseudorhodobacter sp. E13 TaxID=2487931 RepID=UPI000F8E540A|nr:sensor histidine kinase [Pseudorhodobacter sp. E13]RUS59424.1 sensor histidine kinase [Pseudorhodobacter sp. E13]